MIRKARFETVVVMDNSEELHLPFVSSRDSVVDFLLVVSLTRLADQ